MDTLNFGALADKIYGNKDKIAVARAKLEELEGENRALENQLLQGMQQAGTDMVRGKKATVSISTTTRWQFADPEKLFAFIKRKGALHLFERRLSAAACKEMEESLGGKEIPGTSKFPQVRLNIRKV